MLDRLRHIIDNELPVLIRQRGLVWNSLHVTYEPPRVERLWCQYTDLRIFLHRIHPAEGDVLFHPHPWPSAVRIVSGRYLHRIGIKDQVLSTQVLTAGSEYEMTTPDVWHSVNPIDGPSDSVMIVGPLFPNPPTMPSPPSERQQPLDPQRAAELLDDFASFFDWQLPY
jgi:hypothetical protein